MGMPRHGVVLLSSTLRATAFSMGSREPAVAATLGFLPL